MFTGAYGQKHDEDRLDLVGLDPNNQVDKDDRVWYIQPGIEKKRYSLGTTTIFGTYRRDDNGTTSATYTAASAALPLPAGIRADLRSTPGAASSGTSSPLRWIST